MNLVKVMVCLVRHGGGVLVITIVDPKGRKLIYLIQHKRCSRWRLLLKKTIYVTPVKKILYSLVQLYP